MEINDLIRPHAEDIYKKELEFLSENDDKPRPQNWKLSPWAVVTYLLGGKIKGFDMSLSIMVVVV